jgi:hypothetical protein
MLGPDDELVWDSKVGRFVPRSEKEKPEDRTNRILREGLARNSQGARDVPVERPKAPPPEWEPAYDTDAEVESAERLGYKPKPRSDFQRRTEAIARGDKEFRGTPEQLPYQETKPDDATIGRDALEGSRTFKTRMPSAFESGRYSLYDNLGIGMLSDQVAEGGQVARAAHPTAAKVGAAASWVGPELGAVAATKAGRAALSGTARKIVNRTAKVASELTEAQKAGLAGAAVGGAGALADDPTTQVGGMGMAAFGFVPGRNAKATLVSPLVRHIEEKFATTRSHTLKEWATKLVDGKGTPKGAFKKAESDILLDAIRATGSENQTLTRDQFLDFARQHAYPIQERRLTPSGRNIENRLADMRPRIELRRQAILEDVNKEAPYFPGHADEIPLNGPKVEKYNETVRDWNETRKSGGEAIYGAKGTDYTTPNDQSGYQKIAKADEELVWDEPKLPGEWWAGNHYPQVLKREIQSGETLEDMVKRGAAEHDDSSVGGYFFTDDAQTGSGMHHIRASRRFRPGPDGKQVNAYYVEEMQSDFGNKVRKVNAERKEALERFRKDGYSEEEARRLVDEWQPAMSSPTDDLFESAQIRRVMAEAAAGGHDELVFASPAEQIRRYGTESITYDPQGYANKGPQVVVDGGPGAGGLMRFDVDPDGNVLGYDAPEGFVRNQTGLQRASRLLGKDERKAREMIEAVARDKGNTSLRPRAEGMEREYGVNLETRLRKISAQLGIDLPMTRNEHGELVVQITPELRQFVQGKGMTLYTSPAAVGAAVGGAFGGMKEADSPDQRVGNIVAGSLVGGAAGGIAHAVKSSFGAKLANNPAFKAMEGWIDFGGSRQEAASALATGQPVVQDWNRFDKLLKNWQNAGRYLDRFGDQPTVMGGVRPTQNPGVLRDRVKAADHILHHAYMGDGLRDLEGNLLTNSLESVVKGTLGEDPENIRKGFDYLVAKRIVNRGVDAVGGNAQRFAEADAVATAGAAVPEITAFADKWEEYMDGVMKYAVESGLWTPTQAAAFKSSDALYVPLERIVAELSSLNRNGPSMVNVDDAVRRFVGSQRAVRDPALASIQYVERIIRRADRYRVGASLFNVADNLGDDVVGLVRHGDTHPGGPAQGPGVFDSLIDDTFGNDPLKNSVIWRNNPMTGAREYATLTDPNLMEALQSLNHETLSRNPKVRKVLNLLLGLPKRLLTAGTTGTPGFTLGTNITRDFFTAMAQSQAGMGPGDWIKGFADAVRSEVLPGGLEEMHKVRQAGLGGVSAYTAPKDAAAVQRAIAPISSGQQLRHTVAQGASAPLRLAEKIGDISDLGPRAAEVRAAMEKMAPKVASGEWTEGDLRAYGAHLGRRSTIDFSNRGANPLAAVPAEFVPFFGATLNAMGTYADAIRRNPKRVLAVNATVALAAGIGWAMKQRLSPEVRAFENDRTASERSAKLYFPVNEDLTVTLPVPQELGLPAHLMTAALDKLVENDPNAGAYVAEAIMRLVPPNPLRSLPLVGGMYDVAVNERDYTKSTIETMDLRNLSPENRRRDETSPVWDVVSGGIRKAANALDESPILGRIGDELVPDILQNLSPIQAEHIGQRLTGTVPKAMFEAVFDPLATRMTGRERSPRVPQPLSRHPLNPMRAFIAPNAPGATQSEIEVEKLDKLYGQADRTMGDMEGEEAVKFKAENPILYGEDQFEYLRGKVKDNRKERDQINEYLRLGFYNQQTARRMLDQLNRSEGKMYRDSRAQLDTYGIK